MLAWLCGLSCPGLAMWAVLSWPGYVGCPVLTWLCGLSCPGLAMWAVLCWPGYVGCPVLAWLCGLSCPDLAMWAVLSWPGYVGCPVLAWLCGPSCRSALAVQPLRCVSNHSYAGFHVTAVMTVTSQLCDGHLVLA